MRSLIAVLTAGVLLASPLAATAAEVATASTGPLGSPASVASSAAPAFGSPESVLHWIHAYRSRPDPGRLPAAYRAASEAGALATPDAAGIYVGFLAGVIAAQPTRADRLIAAILPFPQADSWVIVRAIAYSGHPDWKGLLARNAARLPQHAAMIEAYVNDRMPTLARLATEDDPTVWTRMRGWLRIGDAPTRPARLAVGPDVLDTLWGVYFATGDAGPIGRIVALLPWSQEQDDLERLTVGSMAKFTLVANASRDPALLALLREEVSRQPPATAAVLKDAVAAAETVDVGRVRKEALAAIRALEKNRPDSRKELTFWGHVGEGAMSLGCVAAAAVGQVALGLPCVVGGALTSAALHYFDKTN
ncbi:MAG: hypothetical protein HXX10_04790 [Rhodoplanes sp.]|uniref:hypothetical protein n=1 Tax=Rhodoplanes sp. TaxID=1968906 RepID=UPI001857A67F|nr:hypothetical protein [Rhodoplanes sp.]NVO13334.1 hypothetical protein [Rhodoplanes sp.]